MTEKRYEAVACWNGLGFLADDARFGASGPTVGPDALDHHGGTRTAFPTEELAAHAARVADIAYRAGYEAALNNIAQTLGVKRGLVR